MVAAMGEAGRSPLTIGPLRAARLPHRGPGRKPFPWCRREHAVCEPVFGRGPGTTFLAAETAGRNGAPSPVSPLGDAGMRRDPGLRLGNDGVFSDPGRADG